MKQVNCLEMQRLCSAYEAALAKHMEAINRLGPTLEFEHTMPARVELDRLHDLIVDHCKLHCCDLTWAATPKMRSETE